MRGDLLNCYKIKLLKGYRLVYTVEDDVLVVPVLAVNKRGMAVYYAAIQRLSEDLV